LDHVRSRFRKQQVESCRAVALGGQGLVVREDACRRMPVSGLVSGTFLVAEARQVEKGRRMALCRRRSSPATSAMVSCAATRLRTRSRRGCPYGQTGPLSRVSGNNHLAGLSEIGPALSRTYNPRPVLGTSKLSERPVFSRVKRMSPILQSQGVVAALQGLLCRQTSARNSWPGTIQIPQPSSLTVADSGGATTDLGSSPLQRRSPLTSAVPGAAPNLDRRSHPALH
jgi:hypothetical protein